MQITQSLLDRANNRATILPISTLDSDGIRITANIRIWGIDAPEREQPFFLQAFAHLDALIVQEDPHNLEFFTLEFKAVDCYGRIIAQIRKGLMDVGEELVKSGLAWAIEDYYKPAEQYAQKKKLGLWKEMNPTPPWEWRKEHPRNKEQQKCLK